MPVYKREGIIGYHVRLHVYCLGCFEKRNDKRFNDVITEDETQEYLYVCDECHQEIE